MATYFAVATGNWTSASVWALSSGGAGGAGTPTATDDVVFDAASGAVNVTVPASGTRTCANLTINGYTGTLTVVSGSAVSVSGNVAVQTTGWTMTGLATLGSPWLQMGGTSKTLQTSGKDIGGAYVTAGSVTMLDAIASSTGPATVRADGSFNTGGFNVTVGSFQSSVNATRTVTLGASTVTLSLAGTALAMQDIRGLTLSAASSTITFTGAGAAMNVGSTAGSSGLTFGTVKFNGSGTGSVVTSGSVPLTFTTLERNGTNGTAETLTFSGFNQVLGGVGVTHVIANLNISSFGATPATRVWVRVVAGLSGTQIGLNVGTAMTITNGADFMDVAFSGAASKNWSARSDVGDCGGNSGATFPAGVTNYWVGGNTGGNGWATASHWASSSGGGASSGRIPLPQDDVRFDANSGLTAAASISLNVTRLGRNLDFTGVVSMTVNMSLGSCGFFGSLTLSTGVASQVTGGASALVLWGRSGGTITSAGRDFNACAISCQAGFGKYTLADALTITAANWSVTDGWFDTGSFTVTCLSFTHNAGVTWWRSSTVIAAATAGVVALNPGLWATHATLRVTNTSSTSVKTLSASLYVGEVRVEGGSTAWTLALQSNMAIGTLRIVGTNKTIRAVAGATTPPAVGRIINESGAPWPLISSTTGTQAGIRPATIDANGNFAYANINFATLFLNGKMSNLGGAGTNPQAIMNYADWPGFDPGDGPRSFEVEADIEPNVWPPTVGRSVFARHNLGLTPALGFDLSITTGGAVTLTIGRSTAQTALTSSAITSPPSRFIVKVSYDATTGIATFSWSIDGGVSWTALGTATAPDTVGPVWPITYADLVTFRARDVQIAFGLQTGNYLGSMYRASVYSGTGGGRTLMTEVDARVTPSYDVNASVTDSDASIGGGWWNSNGTNGGNNTSWTFNRTLTQQPLPRQSRPAVVRAARW